MGRKVRYTNDEFENREGQAVEKNGNLTYVEDQETGEGSWWSPHEIREEF